MTTVAGLVGEGSAALARAGVEAARAEARLLLEAATGLSRVAQATDPVAPVGDVQVRDYRALLARRAAREPIAYLRGRVEFWSLELAVGPGVLVPRADTETLVEVASGCLLDRAAPWRFLDLGTGSGCLACALLHLYPNARCVGTDRSAAALDQAGGNARRLGLGERLRLLETSWAAGVDGPFDLVVANPPYIPSGEIEGLQPEVARFEPRLALDGGPDGLDAYRAILADLPRLLAPGGAALLEIGRGQEGDVATLAARAFSVATHSDLAGIVRCLELRSLTQVR